mmetsp:Transcript_22363/g.36966  ORF Transcript_22363/g.36966 Transcript_22363/m.36966 type:complete len:419 (-) Transcript_22363:111-1367(-)|eukprot:CAMPEP_0184662092 /NCGR_PEP_ID=MMETSP0308-20130426/41530_1 /TAXON_ID=38269 /ORGANISM="Gloeochaete witrockiana, Strain SAG 46.84" /LENGTH=418 /DNA_ID=CAMNT_0027103847 /DNA_START=41 /DNA_END=1300 /DNA_ORIENTATION=-
MAATPLVASNVEYLKSLWNKEEASDVRLVALGKEYRLHKIIINQAPFFATAFSGRWSRNGNEPVDLNLEDSSSNAVEKTLKTLYGFDLSIATLEEGLEIQTVAAYLQLEKLEKVCSELMLPLITLESSVQFQKEIGSRVLPPAFDMLKTKSRHVILLEGHTRPDLLARIPDLTSFLNNSSTAVGAGSSIMVGGGEYERLQLVESITTELKRLAEAGRVEKKAVKRAPKRVRSDENFGDALRSSCCRMEFLSVEQLEPYREVNAPDITKALWAKVSLQHALSATNPNASSISIIREFRYTAKLAKPVQGIPTTSARFDAFGAGWVVQAMLNPDKSLNFGVLRSLASCKELQDASSSRKYLVRFAHNSTHSGGAYLSLDAQPQLIVNGVVGFTTRVTGQGLVDCEIDGHFHVVVTIKPVF